jgi:hypothetical protein
MQNIKDTLSYIQGAKLGDFIHSLCVCKYNYETQGKKADLYIANGGDVWEKGVEYTYNDLKPLLKKQEWLNSFKIYDGSIDLRDINYHLIQFRVSPLLFRTNWIELYFNDFLNVSNPPKEYSWIETEKDESLKNTVLVNRNMKPMSDQITSIYRTILEPHDDVAFICFDKEQYDNFKLKDKCRPIFVDNLTDFFTKINSCKLYVGNQSAPSAFSVALNVPRIIELHNINMFHYMKDKEYYKNFDYFISDVL